MKSLEDYRDIVGDEVIADIYSRTNLYDRNVLHVNSTYQGGGVAEILNSLILLMNDIGINTEWDLLHGTPDFFNVTKLFHHGLHGEKIELTTRKKKIHYDINKTNAAFTRIDHDCVIIHDPQPIPLIMFYHKTQPWIWRCHVDMTKPDPTVWGYLKGFASRYDHMVVSMDKYKSRDLKVPQSIIMPSIDPLTPKNQVLSESKVKKYMARNGVDVDEKPIISQISRFDKWKDPFGVVELYKKAKKEVDCQLVMVGNMATDDPDGQEMYDQMMKKVEDLPDVHILLNSTDIEVNAAQRASSVIIQKSIKEGFGLSVTEGMWKQKPVVASKVGGIPLQIQSGKSGYLVNPHDNKGFASKIVKLLKDEKLNRKMGLAAEQRVKDKFLITRHLVDYLDLMDGLVNCKNK